MMLSSRRRSRWWRAAAAALLAIGGPGATAGCAGSTPSHATAVEPDVTMAAREADTPASAPTPTAQPTAVPTPEPARPTGPVAPPIRSPAAERPIYFVMPDRFDNGDPSNDRAGLDGDQLVHGFDPTHQAWHHGGDIAGLTRRLDYLQGLGVGAIWITPPFTNRFVQGDGTVEGSSSGYHGYWQIDWSRIDPHLGTDADMAALVAAAHARDINVYFDIVVNHTGDVIAYDQDSYVYWSTSARPYRDSDGVEFDPADHAGSGDFPALDPAVSFPYAPVFVRAGDEAIKSPAWLNDVTLYHNRGNSTFQGESSQLGDFYGLDDLFTEHPKVVQGMIELHGDLIERFDIDGFRIDTMKHVDLEFWRAFAPAIRQRAAELGKPDFYLFGEVFNTDPISQSAYTTIGVDATLDFIVDDALGRYVAGRSAELLADAFDTDDWFTDADSNASMQVSFFGNHDRGRMGYLLDRAVPGAADEELLDRMRLGFDLLYLTRGTPVIYYGDEQGFTGDGGDQLARQDMFESQTPAYVDDRQIGADTTPGDNNFAVDHPLYRYIAGLAQLRAEHRAFATGAQIVHEPIGPVFAMSRIDRDDRVEYLVLTNSNGSITVPARVAALSADTTFLQMAGGADPVKVASDQHGEVVVEVPPLTTIILRAERPLAIPEDRAAISIARPGPGTTIPTERYRIQADLSDDRYAEVTFAVAVDGGEPQVIGVDDNAPYRVYWSNGHVPAGTEVTIFATVADASPTQVSTSVEVTLGDR